ILLAADFGAMFGRPLYRQAELLVQFLHDDPSWLLGVFRPPGMQWRIVTPGLIFVYYAAFIALVMRAREVTSRRRVVAAGVAYGLLFYVLFYYWTAVALGLLLGMLVDAGRRRLYLQVSWIGGLIGLPIVISGLLMRHSAAEALVRFNLFLPVARWDALSCSI